MTAKLRVLVVGLGKMGRSHALAYARIEGCEVVGLCSRSIHASAIPDSLATAALYTDFRQALTELKPDIVSVNTLPDTHAEYAIAAMEAGAHVFVEKPLAENLEDAERVIAVARSTGRKLLVGYILRQHPSWLKFAELARGLGKPLVMRMNLNQQSRGASWLSARNKLEKVSPIVDCAVHYVDYMCAMTGARPVKVHAIGARLSDEISGSMYNYGQLQLTFDDGSIGWYEVGWGPMMSETAHFIKDVIGPRGSVSMASVGKEKLSSDDIRSHTQTNRLIVHNASLGPDGRFAHQDELIDTVNEPDHEGLCEIEQRVLIDAIDGDHDLSPSHEMTLLTLRIVLAADRSIRTGEIVWLG
jgi:predicted dehydrogenase